MQHRTGKVSTNAERFAAESVGKDMEAHRDADNVPSRVQQATTDHLSGNEPVTADTIAICTHHTAHRAPAATERSPVAIQLGAVSWETH